MNIRQASTSPLPPTKRRRTQQDPPTTLSPPPESGTLISLSEWPDDVLVHLLQFLDLETLENFDLTCRRVHFFVTRNINRLIQKLIPNTPLATETQQLIASRSVLLPCPPKYSFAYIHYFNAVQADFKTIVDVANPVKS